MASQKSGSLQAFYSVNQRPGGHLGTVSVPTCAGQCLRTSSGSSVESLDQTLMQVLL